MQYIGEGTGDVEFYRHDDHAVGVGIEGFESELVERLFVETFVVGNLYVNVEVTTSLHRLLGTFLNLVPIGFRLVFRQ